MRIFFADFKSRPMDIDANFEKAMAQLDRCIAENCDVIIYPVACLLGAQPGVLKRAEWLCRTYNTKMAAIYEKAAGHNIAVVADSIDTAGGNYTAEIKNGTTESCGRIDLCGFKTRVATSSAQLFANVHDICSGTDIVFINWMEKTVAGQKYLWTETLKKISAKYGTIFAVNTAGKGYTTHPDFYTAVSGLVCDGTPLLYSDGQSMHTAVLEKPVLHNIQADDTDYADMVSFPICHNQNPLIPANVPQDIYCTELFNMQSQSLANRLENIGCKDIVLNLSGGLDSTAALLVCVNAFDMLKLDRKGLHIYTMPGFGTSGTTKNLAHELCDGFGIRLNTVDITETCRQALLSIGHDGVTPDVTFENVQARCRTMNALNLANRLNAIMVGTGDLSEAALGFSTFGGDQIASYNVNCCVSKTVMRTMLGYVINTEKFACVKGAVEKILSIPVSPELVPHNGEILQKTEEILAPYKLIDFFIYCTLISKIPPKDVVSQAYEVFGGEFSKEYIREKLKMFYRKFAVGQFKRSCAPESANITHVSLAGADAAFASDGSPMVFIQNM